MLEKNKKKKEQRGRPTWSPYYQRVTKDKTRYTRKRKHKGVKDYE